MRKHLRRPIQETSQMDQLRATNAHLPVLGADRRVSCMRVATHLGGHGAIDILDIAATRVLRPAHKPKLVPR